MMTPKIIARYRDELQRFRLVETAPKHFAIEVWSAAHKVYNVEQVIARADRALRYFRELVRESLARYEP